MHSTEHQTEELVRNKQLQRKINGATKQIMQKCSGSIQQEHIGKLTNQIMIEIQGIVNDAIIKQMQKDIDRNKYVVISKKRYDTLVDKDSQRQIKYLRNALKEANQKIGAM